MSYPRVDPTRVLSARTGDPAPLHQRKAGLNNGPAYDDTNLRSRHGRAIRPASSHVGAARGRARRTWIRIRRNARGSAPDNRRSTFNSPH